MCECISKKMFDDSSSPDPPRAASHHTHCIITTLSRLGFCDYYSLEEMVETANLDE